MPVFFCGFVAGVFPRVGCLVFVILWLVLFFAFGLVVCFFFAFMTSAVFASANDFLCGNCIQTQVFCNLLFFYVSRLR